MKKLDVVFILDKSGSMSGSEDYTISSFNEYLLKEKKRSYETNITTILFSDIYQYLHNRVPAKKVEKLMKKDYQVGGCTALYDAIGHGIHSMDCADTDKVLFIIITDGYENASLEFSKNKIQEMIQNHSNWEFIYIGADIDSYAAGGELGIQKEKIANYTKDKRGTSKLFKVVDAFECAMMDENVSNHWKKDLES